MDNLGRIFRDIRIGKNYSLKQVSEGIMSTSFLSKFERGETEISLKRFYLLLDRLSLTLEEFSFISNDFRPSRLENLMSEVRKAYENNNVKLLLKLEKEENLKWEKYGVDNYRYNSIVIKALAIDLNKDGTIDNNDIHIVGESCL